MADRVLVIGATSTERGELASAFTDAGFVTSEAPDYPEAIAQVENFRPDIVIIDEALPSRDSLEVSSELRNDFDLPVVVLGRDVSDEVWQKVMEAGVDLYQKRPFSYVLLIARVKAILRRYKGEVVKKDSVRRMSREE